MVSGPIFGGCQNDMPFFGCEQDFQAKWEPFPGAILTMSSLCGIVGMGVLSFRFACSHGRFVQLITILQLLGFSMIVSRSAALHIPMQLSPMSCRSLWFLRLTCMLGTWIEGLGKKSAVD